MTTIFNTNHKTRFICLITICLLILTGSQPVFSQEPSKDVAITFISDEVLVLKKSATEWQKASPGDILSEGDSIKTLEGAKAKLQFPSGSTIILKENTTLVIDKLAAEAPAAGGKTEVSLPKGRVKAVIERLLDKESEFEVRTPTAVAGVAGTVFYLNVVKKSEAILSSAADDNGTKYAHAKPPLGLLFTDFIMGSARECYAQEEEGVVTEIFVEEGYVDFTNILSNLSYNVVEGNGSSADDEGGIAEPEDVPPDKQEEWKAGFELPQQDEKKEEEKKEEEKKKDEKKEPETTPVTQKAEESVIEKGATEEAATGDEGAETPEVGLPETDAGTDSNESKDEQNDNSSEEKTEAQDTDTDVNVTVTTEDNDTDVDITVKTDDDYLREELVELHNDMVEAEQRITLAQLDARLEEIQDAQDGKVIKDIHGNTVRYANYVLRPTDKKVAIIFLNHRRDGEHKGVSSLTFEVAFNTSLDGVNLKTEIPWSDIMGSDDEIIYSSKPTYYPKSGNEPAVVLTMRNPSNDYLKIYEGFGELAEVGGVWQQAELKLTYNMDINGVLKQATYSAGTTTGGSYSAEQTFADSTYYKITGNLINDDGVLQGADVYTDGTSKPLRIDSIRGILRPERKYNLEITIEMEAPDEFEGRKTIDVIVTPEIMEPYHDND